MALECGTDSERKRSYSHYLSRILGPQCDGTTISLLPDPPLSLRFPLLRRRRRYLCPLSSISLLFRTLKGRERRGTGAAAPDYPASFTSLLFIHSSIHASIHPSPAEERCRVQHVCASKCVDGGTFITSVLDMEDVGLRAGSLFARLRRYSFPDFTHYIHRF